VGIYQANYRLGIFMVLLVSMFDQAWRPFFLERADKPESVKVFARVLTYFVLALVWLGLALSFFIPDLVRFRIAGKPLIHPDYWPGLKIVPVVLFAYLMNGVYVNFLAPVIIAKKTKAIMLATLSGAAVSVAANFALIPRLGIFGPPWAAFAAYCVMAVTVYYAGRRFFPVPYEFGRLGLIVVTALVLSVPALAGWFGGGWTWFIYRLGVLAAYPLCLLALGFFVPEEKLKLRELVSRYV
jgi:O-antigen/teichoic acid export membrane protein